jgi:hypothetical protein
MLLTNRRALTSGTMDCLAYMPTLAKQSMCDQEGWTLVSLRDRRYDAVIHLITTASGAEEYYTLDNNSARSESIEEARDMDIKVLQSWVGHSNLHVIDNSTTFDEKVRRATARICRIIGVPVPPGTRRKFLMRGSMPDVPVVFEDFESETVFLRAAVGVDPKKDGYSFVRRRGQSGSHSYTYSTRVSLASGAAAIEEKQISSAEYIRMLDQADSARAPTMRRSRCFVWNNIYYEIVEYTHPREGLVLLYAESESPDEELPMPPFLHRLIDREVTNDDAYSSFEISIDK